MTILTLDPTLAHTQRRPGTEVDTVVLHATAGSTLQGAIETLRQKGLSYHYIIEKSGVITKCCPAAAKAFHAGESTGPQGRYCNEYSVGISFINLNDGGDVYTLQQKLAAQELVEALKTQFPLKWITTHYLVSPGRKTDPKGYPIDAIALATGLRVWRP